MNNTGRKTKPNAGIAFLRLWMCFEVAVDHFYDFSLQGTGNPFTELILRFGKIAVPVFMIIAFVMTDIQGLSKDRERFEKRLKRILLPQILWSLLYFLVFKTGFLILKKGSDISFRSLLFQLGFGHAYNQAMWFQVVLFVLTLLFVLIFRFFKERALPVCIGLGLLSYALQYTGLNSFIVTFLTGWMNTPSLVSYPLGRIAECIPFAVTGILFRQLRLHEKDLRKNQLVMLTAGSLILIALCFLWEDHSSLKGFGYHGIQVLLIGLSAFLPFYYFGKRKLPERISGTLLFLSRYTLGVYCVHTLVIRLIEMTPVMKVLGLSHSSLVSCALIFMISWIISFVISLVPSDVIKAMVM